MGYPPDVSCQVSRSQRRDNARRTRAFLRIRRGGANCLLSVFAAQSKRRRAPLHVELGKMIRQRSFRQARTRSRRAMELPLQVFRAFERLVIRIVPILVSAPEGSGARRPPLLCCEKRLLLSRRGRLAAFNRIAAIPACIRRARRNKHHRHDQRERSELANHGHDAPLPFYFFIVLQARRRCRAARPHT
jgi:hypothetical protein